MKKKFIAGVLLLAMTAVGGSTFTSCKDNNEADFIENKADYAYLKKVLDDLQTKVGACQTSCQQKIADLLAKISTLQSDKADKSELTEAINDLKDVYVAQAAYDDAMEAINNRLEALEKAEPGNPLEGVNIDDLKALLALKAQLEELTKLDLEGLFGENGTIADIQGDINDLKGSVQTAVETTIPGLETSINGILDILNGKGDAEGLVDKVNGLGTAIDELNKWFDGIGITPAQFQEYVKQGEFVKTNKVALEALVKLQDEGTLNEDALKALNSVYEDLDGIKEMYETIFKGVEAPEDGWWNYAEVIENIKANTAAIAELQKKFQDLLDRMNDMVTGLVLQATANPVFGGFNSPFGLNSMVLMTCYGENTTGITQFPSSQVEDCNLSFDDNDIDWDALNIATEDVNEMIVKTNDDNQAELGNLWFTVNPGTVNNLDLNGFALVNSREDSIVVLNNVAKDDETVLKFGLTSRAAGNGNGLYQTAVTVDPANLDAIKINIQAGLANTLKDAVKNHTASDMVAMFKAIYGQLKDVCDANALRYTYNAYNGVDEAGKPVFSQQKVYSNYGVAATAFKPLSFATLKGTSFNVKFPTISPIELNKDLVNLNLKPFTIGNVTLNINLKISAIELNAVGETVITVKIPNKYDVNVDPATGEGSANLPDGWDADGSGMYEEITVNIGDKLNEVVESIQKSIEEWINGVPGNEDKPGLNAQINSAISEAVDAAFNDPETGLVPKLEGQVNDMMGSIQDKLNDLVDKINNEYLGKVNSLIDRYNTVAERISNMLKDPNHYLQVAMLYRKAGKLALNGAHVPEVELPFGLLSTNPKQPTQFKGAGDAISLWATTYNFETICPTFKKAVVVTKVTTPEGENTTLRDNANKTLAQVLPGDRNRVALNVAGAPNGTVYEIAYQALDYSGFTSTVKCYVQVIR